MSDKLSTEIRLGMDQLQAVTLQISVLLDKPSDFPVGTLEINAACAMLHSFYTEIEKILKLIAREWDGNVPTSESWHRELLRQMAAPTGRRPAILTGDLHERLGEFLAFRHLFRGASIAIMRWPKLAPLIANVENCHQRVRDSLEAVLGFFGNTNRLMVWPHARH